MLETVLGLNIVTLSLIVAVTGTDLHQQQLGGPHLELLAELGANLRGIGRRAAILGSLPADTRASKDGGSISAGDAAEPAPVQHKNAADVAMFNSASRLTKFLRLPAFVLPETMPFVPRLQRIAIFAQSA